MVAHGHTHASIARELGWHEWQRIKAWEPDGFGVIANWQESLLAIFDPHGNVAIVDMSDSIDAFIQAGLLAEWEVEHDVLPAVPVARMEWLWASDN